ncbi:MAG: adenylyltransferase/cytidyltransferase family protein [Muribaculaceae bacterium]|nr:adenylyltransferase/cytidyltransferase family protein [Muribaculaceae bacterium]
MRKSCKVFATGFFDLLNSGHVAFLKEAAKYGELYVGIGSDVNFERLKGRKPVASEQERLYMVKALRYVKDAFVNSGCGILDFLSELDRIKPDVFVVNSNGGNELKKQACESRGIEYVSISASHSISGETAVLASETQYNSHCEANTEPTAQILRTECANTAKQDFANTSRLPYRVDIAGTWIDQPYVSKHGAGWAITASIEPTHEFMERGGMSTSTRNAAKKIWPFELPAYNEEMLARMLFCFENDPENTGHVSGAQDAIGICISGLSRHYYDGHYWPEKIETIHDDDILDWLEQHLCVVPMFPRRPGCSVVEGKDITSDKVKDLTDAAARCWDAIMMKDLETFANAFRDSFNAQIAMFPAMMQPGVQEHIDNWKDRALAWKMLGAGGGGHLLLVVDKIPSGTIPIKIRRR